MSFFKKLRESIASKTESVTKQFRDGLEKSRKGFVEKVTELVTRRKKIDEEFFEELEEILIGADVGVNTVMKLIDDLRAEVKQRRIENASELQPLLSEKLTQLLRGDEDSEMHLNPDGISVILFVGVNGVGKTTTIGKLAHYYKQQGKKVILAAGDTSVQGRLSSSKFGVNALELMSSSNKPVRIRQR